jgi:peptidoglycan hydrolase-like protein with peptidoglycan-binding domain
VAAVARRGTDPRLVLPGGGGRPRCHHLADQADPSQRRISVRLTSAVVSQLAVQDLPTVQVLPSGPALTPDRGCFVGSHTWSALIITVRQGDRGDAVRGVQEEFQFRNGSGDPRKGLQVDGIFGPRTAAAVRDFQQALHTDIPSVAVDGIVGPVTWRALVSGMLSF